METLNLSQGPSTGSDLDFAVRLIENQFGDGYRQTAPDGLNAVVRTWNLHWTELSIDNAGYLESFLVAHVGRAFLYRLPRDQYPRAWDCKVFRRGQPAGGYDSFSATFVERFDLG